MTFNSFEFIFLFLPVTITLFYTLSRSHKNLGILCLILASLAFYGSLSLRSLPLLLVSTCVNFCISLTLSRSSCKKLCMTLGLLFNFGVLVYFKISGALPLGISFYTFTQSAYLVDIYRAKYSAAGFLDYVRHITFFGCIASGPIARIPDTCPEFSPDYDSIAKGLTLFFMGLFKKVYVADSLGKTVNQLFAASGTLNFTEAWLAVLAYALQLYFDFSGYSDMAIGTGLMFGMRLPQNFDSPYKSLSLIDFWRRWHMSLGAWIRDYVYIPLGGSREGELKRTRNVMLAMLFTGLWHGMGWTFLLWGGLHGMLLAVNHWWRRHDVKLPVLLAWVMTFGSVVLLWAVFRAESLSQAREMVSAMADVGNIALPTKFRVYLGFLESAGISFVPFMYKAGTFAEVCIRVFVLLAAVIFAPNTKQIIDRFKPSALWIVITFSLAVMSFMNFSGISDFLYFQF